MSLWSPVDLVSGGTGKTNANITINSVNSTQFRSAKREDRCPPNYTNSLLYDHLLRRSSSKLSDNNVITKDLNSATNRVVMTSNDSSHAVHNSKKRQTIKGLVNLSIDSQVREPVVETAIPLLRSKNRDEVNENCDKKHKNNRNSNTMSKNEEEDCAPLDLCVKKPNDESNQSSSVSRKSSIFTKSSVNWDVSHTNSTPNTHKSHNNVITNITGIAAINTPQYNPSSHSSRKRGRKPKSLLATTSTTGNIIVPSSLATFPTFGDNKPRKRGRPPTLSPPLLSAPSQQPLAAHSSNFKALSSSGAFQHHFPYAVLNTPLQPGWPSLSSTGQLVFPDKHNGSEVSKDIYNKLKTLQQQQLQQQQQQQQHSAHASESSDNLDSLASDSDSIDESVSDSGSQASHRTHTSGVYGQLMVDKINENELRIPLQLGWRRETRITRISKSGVEGEVVYYSPCDRKLRTYSEVIKHLEKTRITNVSKRYFNFNSKIIIGTYKQSFHNSRNEIVMNEKEVRKQIDDLRRTAGSRLDLKRKSSNDTNIHNVIHNKESQFKNLMIDRTRVAIPRESKRVKSDMLRRERELKEQELIKIAKTQQLEESRRKKREEMEKQRQEDIVRKVQEREVKRQQLELIREQEIQRRRELLIMADMERERRRQHMMLVRSLDAHKRQEEKERKKEEILAERMRIQEKKMQKKRLEMELLRELKKPVDDMMLKDLQPLPTLNRIPGLKLSGKTFADTLMVFEFLHNFGETLGFDMESLPTLNTLTLALLNIDDSSDDELLSIIHHLLVCSIEDPGLPTNVTTIMGQKLKDAPITNHNITEILRLYFQSFDYIIKDDMKEERTESRVVKLLEKAIPFLALKASEKAEIMAFLCNELLCNQSIVKQIDENIETVAAIRRDKWINENELRKWKAIKAKREAKEKLIQEKLEDNQKKSELETGDDESGDSDAEDTQNVSITIVTNETDEEAGLTNEEIDKKIDKLNKQFNQMNNKLNKAINMYRVCPLGQDRYRRRYWVLPNAGGVFVEGIESGEPEELQNNEWTEEEENMLKNDTKSDETTDEKDDNENKEIECSEESSEKESKSDDKVEECEEDGEVVKQENEIKDEMSSTNDEEVNEIKKESNDQNEEEVEEMNTSEVDSNIDVKSDLTLDLKSDLKSDTKSDTKKQKKANVDNALVADIASSLQNDSQWMSPFIAQVLAGSLMLNNETSGAGGSNSNNNNNSSHLPLSFPFGLDLGNTSSAGSAASSSKGNSSDKMWFSVLPRMPCDESVCQSSESQLSQSNKIKDSVKPSIKSAIETSLSTQQQKLLQQSPLSSLMNGLPSNLFMQAFLYPHILSSLFNQHSLGGGPCPPDTSPFSFGSAANKNASNVSQSTESVEGEESSKPMIAINSDVLIDNELNICPQLQKRIAQQREQQYDSSQKIGRQFQMGWWRITDASQLRLMLEVLHNRGVRERQLHKHLTKYLNYASQSCKSNVAELEITDMDRQIAEMCAFGAPSDNKCSHDLCVTSEWCKEVALRIDIAVLEQIEALEEKIAASSMQIRNWKPMPRISCDESAKFKEAATFLKLNPTKRSECSTDQHKEDNGYTSDDNNCEANESQCKASDDLQSNEDSDEINPVTIGRDRLLGLEAVIERRYLKPPLGFKSNTILVSNNSSDISPMDDYNDNVADENATSGLLRWRDAVRESQCSAEIALCLHFLESCIAWDKSIMRASCQFCGSGENEAQLLLCDGCDKGYHMYCFKPKMESVPEGDWFCFECQNKNTIDKVCVVCGKKGKLLNCDSCAKVFHPNCLDPPMTKPLKGKWICHMCGRKPKKPHSSQKTTKKSQNFTSEEKLIESINNTSIGSTVSLPNSSPKDTSKRLSNGTNKLDKESKKEKKTKQSDKNSELSSCKAILEAMEGHEHSWPFLLPVNTKQFPTYKKIIKKPMDTTTIKSKLDSSCYKNKEDFSMDVRLIFDNCVTFNEDESPVGQAGHNLRTFFEMKWKEHFAS